MDTLLTIVSLVGLTAAVGGLTWWLTRGKTGDTSDGYFLAGRSLGAGVIAGSLMLTNLSTEQLVGLNGDAFRNGLHVFVWEVVAAVALALMALVFLPRFLKSGVTTVPQYLGKRFDATTRDACTAILVLAYTFILLPVVLFSGGRALVDILDVTALTGLSDTAALWITVWAVGLLGSVYAIFGGLKAVAVSDTLNAFGLLIGGVLITVFGLAYLGETRGGGFAEGLNVLRTEHTDRLNSIAPATDVPGNVPFGTIFTGVLLINLYYWCTNQVIIQRTLGASSLKAGQQGVLLAGFLKVLGPLILVVPGLIAFHLYTDTEPGLPANQVYGRLVRDVLPAALTGLFAAALLGAILSSFNSALSSTSTLFSLGVFRERIRPDADESAVVASGRWFGVFVALLAMTLAPFLDGQQSIFNYIQTMNALYFIPILAVVCVGFFTRRVGPRAATAALLIGVAVNAAAAFVPVGITAKGAAVFVSGGWMHGFHFVALVWVVLVVGLLIAGAVAPAPPKPADPAAPPIDLTPWRGAWPTALLLIAIVVGIYACFVDLGVL